MTEVQDGKTDAENSGTAKLGKAMPIPERARPQLQRLEARRQQAEAALASYATGLMAGIGLEGSYTLDIDKWEFTPIIPQPSSNGVAKQISSDIITG